MVAKVRTPCYNEECGCVQNEPIAFKPCQHSKCLRYHPKFQKSCGQISTVRNKRQHKSKTKVRVIGSCQPHYFRFVCFFDRPSPKDDFFCCTDLLKKIFFQLNISQKSATWTGACDLLQPSVPVVSIY